MTRSLTTFEALTFLGEAFNTSPDCVATGLVDATVAAMTIDGARAELDRYTAGIEDEIDPDSVQINADRLDDSDLPAVRIIIRTEAG